MLGLMHCCVLLAGRHDVRKFTTEKTAVVPAEWQLLTVVFDQGTVSFYRNGDLLETLNHTTKHKVVESKDGTEESETKDDEDNDDNPAENGSDTGSPIEMKKCSVKSLTLFGRLVPNKETPAAPATGLFRGDAREVGRYISTSPRFFFCLSRLYFASE